MSMRRGGQSMVLSFPPFTPAVKWLLGINTGIYLLTILAGAAGAAAVNSYLEIYGALRPVDVVHGRLWELLTYAFIHFEFWHWFGNMIAIWMFGSQLEQIWRSRRFLELFFFSAIGAALTTVVLSYMRVLGNPSAPTIGASGGVFGLLMAFGVLFADNEIMMIPFPVQIKAKYFIGILIVIEIIFAIRERGSGIAYLAHLGGLFFGWVYVRFVPRYGLASGMTERMYGVRNSYYRWKRRRAARKFQVYMKKQGREVPFFDEYGNYRGPQTKDEKERGKGPWVN
ncbi:MAG TPA: rhomboid family intramembrane serine protease [Terriglobales bacterium]|jgi:membrane associated rhomboid family serine protease